MPLDRTSAHSPGPASRKPRLKAHTDLRTHRVLPYSPAPATRCSLRPSAPQACRARRPFIPRFHIAVPVGEGLRTAPLVGRELPGLPEDHTRSTSCALAQGSLSRREQEGPPLAPQALFPPAEPLLSAHTAAGRLPPPQKFIFVQSVVWSWASSPLPAELASVSSLQRPVASSPSALSLLTEQRGAGDTGDTSPPS